MMQQEATLAHHGHKVLYEEQHGTSATQWSFTLSRTRELDLSSCVNDFAERRGPQDGLVSVLGEERYVL